MLSHLIWKNKWFYNKTKKEKEIATQEKWLLSQQRSVYICALPSFRKSEEKSDRLVNKSHKRWLLLEQKLGILFFWGLLD